MGDGECRGKGEERKSSVGLLRIRSWETRDALRGFEEKKRLPLAAASMHVSFLGLAACSLLTQSNRGDFTECGFGADKD